MLSMAIVLSTALRHRLNQLWPLAEGLLLSHVDADDMPQPAPDAGLVVVCATLVAASLAPTARASVTPKSPRNICATIAIDFARFVSAHGFCNDRPDPW